MHNSPPPSNNKPSIPKHWMFWALAAALIISLVITINLIYSTAKDAFYVPLPDQVIVEENSEDNSENQIDQSIFSELSDPLQRRSGPRGQDWDGKSTINVLIMGIDDRLYDPVGGPPRTDTLILATMNPETKTAGLLSLPRDLWVEIPGQGEGKINQAYFFGESQGVSGGGAGLAIETVERFLDVDIPFYVQINFHTFIQLIDEIGGVKIDVPEKIMVDLRKGNVKTLEPGVQTLPGDITLAYVRVRNTPGGDFARAQRQQQVLLGIFERLTDFNLMPQLINNAPSLYKTVSGGVNTNLTLAQIAKLAQFTYTLPRENIQHLTIGQDHVVAGFSYNGMYILSPIPEQIEYLKDELFNAQPLVSNPTPRPASTATSNVTATATEEPSLVEEIFTEDDKTETHPTTAPPEEGASVGILNGSGEEGLAGRTAEFLKAHGVRVIEIGTASDIYETSTFKDYSGNSELISEISSILGLPEYKLYSSYDPDTNVDLLLTLGKDWAEIESIP